MTPFPAILLPPFIGKSGKDVPQVTQSQPTPDSLKVKWQTQRSQIAEGIVTFEGSVEAEFGPTVLYADKLTLNYKTQEGSATGNVRLVDPEGSMRADFLEFNWRERTGKASDVVVETPGVRASVSRVEIAPNRWLLYDARATICRDEKARFWVFAKETSLRPGRNGVAKRVGMDLFGWKIGTIPSIGFSLDRRVTGFRLPAVSFRRGVGLGIAWSSSLLLREQLSLTAAYATFPQLLPAYGLILTYNFLQAEKARGLVSPRSDLTEWFGDSYMDNVTVVSPEEEDDYLRQSKRTLSAASVWNQATRGRKEDSDGVSKSVELIGEMGGAIGPAGGFAQVRGQAIRPNSADPFKSRAVLTGSANLGSIALTPWLDVRMRGDVVGFLGDSTYGWLRSQTALLARPSKGFRLAAAYSHGWQAGTPQFRFDELLRQRSLDVRADAKLGPLTLSALFRYDMDLKNWYDRQYAVSLIAGCFEPYVVLRQNPNDVRFGVRFRLDALLGKLQQRDLKRSPAPSR